MNRRMRFHLIARRRDNNQDEILYEFNESFNLYFNMSKVDKKEYKEAIIIEFDKDGVPHNKMSCEFPDYTPYFEKHKKLERKRKNESRRKNI